MFKVLFGIVLGILATLLAPASVREYWSLKVRMTLGVSQDRAATQIHKLSMRYEQKLEDQLNTSAGRREEEARGARSENGSANAGEGSQKETETNGTADESAGVADNAGEEGNE